MGVWENGSEGHRRTRLLRSPFALSIPNAFGAEAARVQKASLYLRMFSHIGDQ